MRKSSQTYCFLGSVAGFFLLALAVFLFYPGSYMTLNYGSATLQRFASLMFWIGLVLGIVLQLVSLFLRRRETPNYGQRVRQHLKEQSLPKRIKKRLFRNRISVILAIGFAIGLVASVISIVISPVSSVHTFLFLAITLLCFCEYLTFNSLNFLYTIRRSEKL